MLPLTEFSNSPDFELSFEHSIQKNILNLKFQVKGKIDNLYKEPTELNLREGSNLWKKTCFEAFFFEQKSTEYRELNFNIFGEYAFLYFESYRVPKNSALPTYKCLDIQKDLGAELLKISATIQLPQEQDLILSPTALLMPKNSETLYFALAHGKKADFHDRQVIENKAFQLLT